VYYTGTYLGTAIDEADFAALALRASAKLDQMTFDRVAAIILADDDDDTIDLIKMATCALAEEMQTVSTAGAVGIQSESVGAHSVTYVKGASATFTTEQRYMDAVKTYLWNTELLYRGFASGEYGGEVDDDD